MKRIIVTIIFLVPLVLGAIVEETASLRDFIYGRTDSCAYDSWVNHVVEGIADPGYNHYGPYDRQMNGFGTFNTPSSTELDNWSAITTQFLAAEFEACQATIDNLGYPYEVVQFTDTETGRIFYMLREIPDMQYYDDNDTPMISEDDEQGAFTYGWGLYIYNPQGTAPVIITIPHISDDYITAPVGVHAFLEWNAPFILFSGVGREVLWTNEGGYNNSKSLCDPTRVEDHPFNVTYQAMCDNVRDVYNHRELSVQIHSYDWNAHIPYPTCQLSPGYNRTNPDLPMRDHSPFKLDIINAGGYTVLPANTVGVHPDVLLNQYWGVGYSDYPFTYSDADTTVAVNNVIDLWGYSQNRQMIYTISGINNWDNFEPFFHIEMDELPYCYEHTTNNFWWFYGYDPETGLFDFDTRFDHTLAFYDTWVQALGAVLPPLFEMDDGELPSTPGDFHVIHESYNSITVGWTPSDSYDHQTYEILYSTQPIDNGGYSTFDASSNGRLASLAETSVDVTGLETESLYYFKIRARDKNNNISMLSEEITGYTGPARITNYLALGRDSFVELRWNAARQINNAGFNVYRQEEDDPAELIGTWETDPTLVGTGENNEYYTWTDFTATNGVRSTYSLTAVDTSGDEFTVNEPERAEAQPIYTLTFEGEGLRDTISFGMNGFASNGYDAYYDIVQDDSPSGNYVFAEFYEQYWNEAHRRMIRQIHGGYDIDLVRKTWTIRVQTNQNDYPITVSASDNFPRDGRKLAIRDHNTGVYTNLADEDYIYTGSSSDSWRYFTLYLGNLVPEVSFSNQTNRFLRAGDGITFGWGTEYAFLIDHIDIHLRSKTDSLFIAGNLPAYASSFEWSAPDGIWMEDMRLVVTAHLLDGDVRTYDSHWQIGILPTMHIYQYRPGWSMVSNPVNNAYGITSICGADAEVFLWTNGAYDQPNVFVDQVGHWLHTPSGNLAMRDDAEYAESQILLDMIQGWNLIPNPHQTSYRPDDLRFAWYGNEFSFAEALQHDLISPFMYVFESHYRPAEIIGAGESFWLHVNKTGVTLRFVPFHDAVDGLTIVPPEILATVLVEQDGGDSDVFTVGASSFASAQYDPWYDMPEPPAKPAELPVSCYLLKDMDFGPFMKYNQEIVALPDSVDQMAYDFTLELTGTDPVTFSLGDARIPEGVHLLLVVEDVFAYLTDRDIVLEPDGTFVTGQVVFTTEHVGAPEDIQPYRNVFTSYPNPFNPETSIRFNLPKAGRVGLAVYNIRGQRIRTLVNGEYPAGMHEIVWEGKNENGHQVSSGVYFFRLDRGGKTEVRKSLLLK